MITVLLCSVASVVAAFHFAADTFSPAKEQKTAGKIVEFTNVNDTTCFFRIKVCGDSASGFFVGSEQNSAGEKIYYAGACQDLIYREDQLSFSLTKYCYSRTPITVLCNDEGAGKSSLNVPVLAQFAMYFDGRMNGSTFFLARVSDLYDSKVDPFVFNVSSAPCDCP